MKQGRDNRLIKMLPDSALSTLLKPWVDIPFIVHLSVLWKRLFHCLMSAAEFMPLKPISVQLFIHSQSPQQVSLYLLLRT